MTTTTADGTPVDLTTATTSRYARTPEYTTVRYQHAVVGVYIPAPGGGEYCHAAVCTHMHPDTPDGDTARSECAERLARIINTGRLPKWATLHNG